MFDNLKENFLYERLPAGVISLDERGLIQAVLGGIQSRIDDLRSYSAKLSLFYSVYGLPDPVKNVVSVELRSPQGVVYKRSLDYNDDTPSATDTVQLRKWAAAQLGMDVSLLGTVQYDTDLLRFVDTSVLEYLAATIGAVLHQSSLMATDADQRAANIQLVNTYFPRLKIKGTAASFDILGRALGFDDVRVTPLWSRMSPRMPQDVGNPVNDEDCTAQPDFYPQQQTGAQYDPLDVRDGPFYAWSGTCSNGTSSTSFYTNVVNGFNPWVSVALLGSIANGTATHVPPGEYALSGGAPNLKAYVSPGDYPSFRFEALVEGETFNGLVISAGTVGLNGTDVVLSISDRLSSVKYRSSYFDLGLTIGFDKAIELFGTQPSSPNKDIYDAYVVNGTTESDVYKPDGVSGPALSPYRPWHMGTLAQTQVTSDFYTRTIVSAGTTVISPRIQTTGTNQEIIVDNLLAAGVQVAQSMEEVRPATRHPRRSATGLLIDDTMRSACYVSVGTLFTTSTGITHYEGSHALTPLGDYTAQLELQVSPGSIYALASSVDPASNGTWHYRYVQPAVTNMQITGSYSFSTGSCVVDFTDGPPNGAAVVAIWTVSDSEVIRPEPSAAIKAAQEFECPRRPEDDDGGLLDEAVDDYPWLRHIVGGGELIEIDTYIPDGSPVDVVQLKTAFQDQTGADYDIYGYTSKNGVLRLKSQARPYDETYVPGMRAIAYKGTFKDISTLSAADTAFIRPPESAFAGTYAAKNDYDVLFNTGYSLCHAGLVQGVLVADAVKFFGEHHRTGLVGWLPLNEHPEEDLTVRDAARTVPGETVLVSVTADSRKWDASRGWYLDLTTSGTVSVTAGRNIGTDVTLSFWIKTTTAATGRRVLAYDPIFVDLNPAGTQLDVFVYDSGGVLTLDHSFTVTPGLFYVIFIVRTSTGYTYALSDLSTPVGGAASTVGSYEVSDVYTPEPLVLSGAAFHDFRVWNVAKSMAELELVRNYAPVGTQVPYPLGFIETANRGDRWGLRVLDNGWITPDALSPWYRVPCTGYVRRYESSGSYSGTPRFKAVGLSSGHILPDQMLLGYVAPTVDVNGTAISSAYVSAVPDYSVFVLCLDDGLVYPIRMRVLGGIPTLEIDTTPVVETPSVLNFLCADDGFVYPVNVSNFGGPFVFLISAPAVLPFITALNMKCADDSKTYPVSVKNDGFGPYINIGFGV